jgi:Flp pilus assembly protein TadG
LVIVAVALLAMIAMVGLVIDGGHAWGQQRDTQNGTDAAAHAGAIRLSDNRPAIYAGTAVPHSDNDVLAAIYETAGQNDIDVDSAFYTNFYGDRLTPEVAVGSLGSADPPVAALGVDVTASKEFETFIAGVMGFGSMTAETSAAARTGPLSIAGANTVLPVTFPITITGCDGTNKVVHHTSGADWELNVPYIVPLCQGDPGNVGWLDWTPTAGGMSEVIASVKTPNNPPLTIPEWHYSTQTGNSSAAGLENAIAKYAVPPDPQSNAEPGTTVLIPLFDATCRDRPSGTGGNRPCDHGEGVGSNMWYHFKDWVAFEIDWVNLNGGSTVCSQAALIPGATGNGSTGCFRGTFRSYRGPGVLEAPDGTETALTPWGVDLVK